ncbi:WxL domain-containing protein [Vagococcus sp. BWB3-3]|uniref:WxL domain-containing protein n=1 Tax=Vagococcus allomyrinae TaxID=2794353 RepID=A0A940PB44_9ENTE|nr:WxL domain-containing protein [Vagococcus allomyrinae]MBP1039443.1 WxL domain-containing protein [Vagococcus allomyrinae]
MIKRTSFVLIMLLAINASLMVEAADDLTGKGTVTFQSSDQETPPVDPENPGEVVDPGPIVKTDGPLRLDLIPRFTFGAQAISKSDQTYLADAQLFHSDTPARANYVQVTDNRGTVAGWELTVKQETQFSNSTTKNNELKGAVLSLDKQWANSTMGQQFQPTIMKDAIEINQIGASYPIATAERGKGNGTWVIQFGSSGEVAGNDKTLKPMLNADGSAIIDPLTKKPMFKNEAISLFVPGKTLKDPVKYTTVLTWTIAELS